MNNTKPPSKSLFYEIIAKIKPKETTNTNIQIANKVPRITAYLHPNLYAFLIFSKSPAPNELPTTGTNAKHVAVIGIIPK